MPVNDTSVFYVVFYSFWRILFTDHKSRFKLGFHLFDLILSSIDFLLLPITSHIHRKDSRLGESSVINTKLHVTKRSKKLSFLINSLNFVVQIELRSATMLRTSLGYKIYLITGLEHNIYYKDIMSKGPKRNKSGPTQYRYLLSLTMTFIHFTKRTIC